jgi:hypothetical protein
VLAGEYFMKKHYKYVGFQLRPVNNNGPTLIKVLVAEISAEQSSM